MAKPELGTKRSCSSCGAHFYDLNRNPFECPICHSVFETEAVQRKRVRATEKIAEVRAAAKEAVVEDEEEDEVDEEDAVAVVEPDADFADKDDEAAEDEVDVDLPELDDDDADDVDDPFVAADDDDDDVSGIIDTGREKE